MGRFIADFFRWQGPPLALGDYILMFIMMIFLFFTAMSAIKPACSKTMRGGDRATFVVLLISSILYFLYYLFIFLVYTLGPQELSDWEPSVGYACINAFGVSRFIVSMPIARLYPSMYSFSSSVWHSQHCSAHS